MRHLYRRLTRHLICGPFGHGQYFLYDHPSGSVMICLRCKNRIP